MVLDIRSARQIRKMRQRDLASAVGISVHELMKLERGLVMPPQKLLQQISQCLEISAEQLIVDIVETFRWNVSTNRHMS